MDEIVLRNIEASDNAAIADIIRTSLAEFGVNKPGTVYYDESTDHLYELFRRKGSVYFVAEKNNELVGGAGIYPSDGLSENVCELVKMYLSKKSRGTGLGRNLMERCLNFAVSTGYTKVYLETFPELNRALSLYEKFGFRYLHRALGNTGHFGCDVWMIKKL